MNTLKLAILLLVGAAWAYGSFRMADAESRRRKGFNTPPATPDPELLNIYQSGTLTASPDELNHLLLGTRFKTGDTVLVNMDSDKRWIQISKNGTFWYSINSNMVQING